MFTKDYILFWLSAILIIAGFQTMFSADFQVKMTNHYNLKVCGEDKNKDILVTVGMGSVTNGDSLYAFDILIEYEPDKVKFIGPIYQNTLAEYIPLYRDVSIGHETKYIRAFGYTDYPLVGNREIIGFHAQLISDCDKPINFKIIDFDLTDDFKQNLIVDSILNITPEKLIDNEKMVEINFNSDSLIFDKNDIANVDVTMNINPYTERDEMYLDIITDDTKPFEILEVISANEYITVDNFTKISDNKYEVKINVFGNTNNVNALTLVVKENEKFENDVIGIFSITPREFEDCNCYSRFLGSDITLISKAKEKDTTSSVSDEEDIMISVVNRNGNIEVINSGRIYIQSIQVFNILGNLVNSYNINGDADVYNFNSTYYKSGSYFIRIVTQKHIVNKSIILYN